MKKLIAIVFLTVTVTASAQMSLVDSIFVKDQTSSFLSVYQMNNSRTPDFVFQNPYLEFIEMSPMEHWERYIKDKRFDYDSIGFQNRETTDYNTGIPIQVRAVALWKNGVKIRGLAYGFIEDKLNFIFDSDLITYYATKKKQ